MNPRERLYKKHRAAAAKALEIMKQKNADYASEGDPFENFRTFGTFGVLVRLSDKLARLRGFESRGELQVKDESIEDTILDAINYLVIYAAMLDESVGYEATAEPITINPAGPAPAVSPSLLGREVIIEPASYEMTAGPSVAVIGPEGQEMSNGPYHPADPPLHPTEGALLRGEIERAINALNAETEDLCEGCPDKADCPAALADQVNHIVAKMEPFYGPAVLTSDEAECIGFLVIEEE